MNHAKKFFFIFFLPALLLMQMRPLSAQERCSLRGTIYELTGNNKRKPLPAATVMVEKYGYGTSSNNNGVYLLENVPCGTTRIKVSFVGKVTIDTLLEMTGDKQIDLVLKDDNFRLKEVVVTATHSEAGQSTASLISDKAMEHLQSVSLDNVMALLPGGITVNPDLKYAAQINIRSIERSNMNALGSAIIQDGAPISNNANLQTMNPAVMGSMGALGGTASPAGGFDTRNITLDNVESVEVIRGIPSVKYGDLTAGAVLIKSKAGNTPLQMKARTNPNVYQFFAQKGTALGEGKGNLTLSADYTYNVNDPVQTYRYYRRIASKAIYSNSFLNNRWKSNTIVDFMYGEDKRDLNPDDKITETVSQGRDMRISLNSNGTLFFPGGFLKNMEYLLSGSVTDKKSHYEQLYTAANASYSMTTVDGAVISNHHGKAIVDVDGNTLTDYTGVDPSDYATYLPSTYKGLYDIRGKEVNLFTKLSATFFKQWNRSDNKILLGGEYRMSGNTGEGKTFDKSAPPYRNLQALNATFRPRPYRDIPFIRHAALYLEDNYTWKITDKNIFKLQAGVRFDKMKDVKGIVTPRLNASLEVIPRIFYLRAGYGVTAKMPTLAYLYPEDAYFEYININEMADERIPENERIIMTTNKLFHTRNSNLKVAANTKAEVGFDLLFDKTRLYVTAFQEHLKNGYSMAPAFKPFTYKEYKRAGEGETPLYELKSSHPVLAKYFMPSNRSVMNTKGVEFDLRIRRIEVLRTTFSFSGAYMQNERYIDDYTYYDNSGEGADKRTHVGLYGPAMVKNQIERFSTALRATHNIPEIGFVVTLTAETVWKERYHSLFGNDTIPVAYISKNDALIYDFDASKKDEPEFAPIIRKRQDKLYIDEVYPPLFNFNINLTKEIGDFLRVSFFANNMFRSYPLVESKRNPGSFEMPGKKFFFGLEVNLLIH